MLAVPREQILVVVMPGRWFLHGLGCCFCFHPDRFDRACKPRQSRSPIRPDVICAQTCVVLLSSSTLSDLVGRILSSYSSTKIWLRLASQPIIDKAGVMRVGGRTPSLTLTARGELGLSSDNCGVGRVGRA